ncbi:MAG: hypothetical protein KFW09_04915 [Oscillospiraceae bacterium]|nr:hypothetical protein [Oscillospiraceae bacterium]
METIKGLIQAMGMISSVGCGFAITRTAIQMIFTSEDTTPQKKKIKNILIVLAISIVIAFSNSIEIVIRSYFG